MNHSFSRLHGIKAVILSLFLTLLFTKPALAAPADSTKVVLTEGTNMAVALSPDKKSLALDLQGTIWTIPVAGGKAKQLTDAMGDCRQPDWSPDGERVVFHSYRDGNYHIWSVRKDGTDLKQMTFGAFDDREPHWAPGGKTIVFSSDRAGNYDIWEMEVATGKLTQLTTDPGNDYYPAYSADGAKIAYVSERNAAPGIYLLDAARKESLLVNSKEKLSSPFWHPDGQSIAFNSFIQGVSQLEYVKVGGGDWQTLSETTEDVFPFKVSWLSPTEMIYMADGKIKRRKLGEKTTTSIPFNATVTVFHPNYQRKVYNFDKGQPKPVKGLRGITVSPDGKRIAFSALGNLWILEKGKAKPTPLIQDGFVYADPAWSPDGRLLAYTCDRQGTMDLWLRDLKTGKDRLLVEASEDLNFPSWSPDGKHVAYYQGDIRNAWGRGTLSMVDIGEGEVEKLHESIFVPSQPSWSPDGKTIAISELQVASSRFREGINKILLISLDKKPDRYVSPTPMRSLGTRGKNGPLWSPDGSQMAYVQDGFLWTLPVDPTGEPTGPPRRLTNSLADSPTWTGDSGSIVYLATDSLRQVFLSDGHIEKIPLDFSWEYNQPTGLKVIHAGKLFNGKDNSYQTNVDIVIENNRIKEIAPHKEGRKGELIDASSQTVMPGLFEMHTHQSEMVGEKLGRLWLSFGITSLRETGSDPYDALERKESWDSGTLPGPRGFFTGYLTDGARIYYGLANSIGSGAQLDLELDRAVRLNYDLLKTYVRMPDYLQERATNYVHKYGIPVSSHEIYPATHYGVDAVEHIGGTSRRGYSPKITVTNNSYQDVIAIITQSGMNITPTASLQGGFYTMASKNPNSYYDNPQFKAFYTEDYIDNIKKSAVTVTKMFPGYLTNFGRIQTTVKKLLAAGAHVTAGTDSPFIPYGISLHSELQCWVDGGVTPFEALRSATLWSAEAVGVSKDLGSVEPGKIADLVIVNGDPLKTIQDAWNVEKVLKNGNVFSIGELLKSPKL
ncbi:amidohydrolase family protein [Persicitalea jodogahamensis]|uniref:Amidohydrolase n=1 Tax=Persicitalea jodogahamensis TaxID=402147 RepID=A0A8J3G9W5_9BACT|nr:amidohydrolase family protein [Persicitalea jodogahamensis]GHB67029.1 amidohydrolase [Persicitalea jodogahamensis]